MFWSGVEEDEVRHPRQLVLAALDEQLESDKVAAGDRGALVDVVKESIRGTPGLLAHGKSAGVPYWVFEWDEAASTIQKLVRDVAAARSRPSLAQWATANSAQGGLPTVRILGPVPWLPPGSLRATVSLSRAPPPDPMAPPIAGAAKPRRPTTPVDPDAQPYQLVVLPDGPRTWVAFSTSEPGLRSALRPIMARAAASDALGAHATERGLDPLRNARMSAGGFVTLASFVELTREASDADGTDTGPRWVALLEHLPGKGKTPIRFTSAPLVPTPDAPGGVREVRVDVPVECIRDVILFSLQAGGP
jgi:hypothetical protein